MRWTTCPECFSDICECCIIFTNVRECLSMWTWSKSRYIVLYVSLRGSDKMHRNVISASFECCGKFADVRGCPSMWTCVLRSMYRKTCLNVFLRFVVNVAECLRMFVNVCKCCMCNAHLIVTSCVRIRK